MNERLAPIAPGERIVALDVLRGVAVLGILVMNVQSFSMIGAAYFIPIAWGDLSGANLVTWWLGELLAHRKFMTLFSLLFGVGIVLQWQRSEAAGRGFGRLHLRRMLWLWVIGMVHAYVFWAGDILVLYSICGLALYPLRKVRPKRLLIVGLALLLVGSALSLGGGLSTPYWNPAQLAEMREKLLPSPETAAREVAAMRGSWGQEIAYRAPDVRDAHLMAIPFHLFWRGAGVMLLGMALYKWKLLGGGRPRAYRWGMAIGLLVGLPLTACGASLSFACGWEPIRSFLVMSQFGYWGSLPMTLGWAGLVLTAIDRGWWRAAQARLAAVGRMALSNYLAMTLICTSIFYGRGLGLFGQVSRVAQLGIVVAVWALLLVWSPWWLRRFDYGPAEWLWRALGYWRRPAWRKQAWRGAEAQVG